jgi:drug/metabolite transporter (DMT)-like permease
VAATTVAQGNILNMTYPLFIAVFTWIGLREQRDPVAIVLVLAAFAGVWLVLAPGDMAFSMDSLWGVASGVTASAAIIYLNLSRRYHDTQTILFFMFGMGGILIYVLFHNHIFIPSPLEASYLLLCAVFGVAGQYLLTLGFRFVTAVEGGIISSTRILLAALLGPLLVADPHLGLSGWIGALLIFGANVYLTLRKVASG